MTTDKLAIPPSSWGAQVARSVNALRPITPPNTLLSDGPFGFGSGQKPQNLRSKSSSTTATLPSCFQISAISGLHVTLTNCYVMLGGKFYSVGDASTGLMSVTLTAQTPNVALAVTTTEENQPAFALSAFGDLQTATRVLMRYLLPLYAFTIANNAATLACDLRNIPTADTYEYQ